MMEIIKKYKNIVLIIVIAVIIFTLYSIFFEDRVSDSLLSGSSGDTDAQSAAVGKEFLSVLLELRSLELKTDIFSDRTFLILRDFSQTVEPQPTGRPNPFANIGNDRVILNPSENFPENSTEDE